MLNCEFLFLLTNEGKLGDGKINAVIWSYLLKCSLEICCYFQKFQSSDRAGRCVPPSTPKRAERGMIHVFQQQYWKWKPKVNMRDHNFTQAQTHVRKGPAVRTWKSEWVAQTQDFSVPFKKVRNHPETKQVSTWVFLAEPLLHLQLESCRRRTEWKPPSLLGQKKMILRRNFPKCGGFGGFFLRGKDVWKAKLQ